MKKIDWEKLKEAYFNECVEKRIVKDKGIPVDYLRYITIPPEEVFDWFKKEISEYLKNN